MQRAELDGSELRLEPGVCGLGRFVQTLDITDFRRLPRWRDDEPRQTRAEWLPGWGTARSRIGGRDALEQGAESCRDELLVLGSPTSPALFINKWY